VQCEANPPSLVAGAWHEITVRAFSQKSPAIAGARVRMEADGGAFESTGNQIVEGLTDSAGKFRRRWHFSKPAARSHVMSVQVTKEGYKQGTECEVFLRESQ
jgi:hypothetical protein